jgi:hypothetical protein
MSKNDGVLQIALSAFERWAADNQYDISPAVLPTADRVYADRRTQEAFDAWTAGAAHAIRDDA